MMEVRLRVWTEEEKETLFETYFSSSPGICPVCSQEVAMIMSELGCTVGILMTCGGCDNKAHVNRPLPARR